MDVQPLGSLARTHTCGELTDRPDRRRTSSCSDGSTASAISAACSSSISAIATASPRWWCATPRSRRTPSGFAPSSSSASSAASMRRAKEAINPKLKTGEIEIAAREIRLLNDAKTPPFPINEDTVVSEEMRLRYRYLDLRRPRLQQNMILRHKVLLAVRHYFDEQRLPRDRNADPDEVDAGRGARLPGAEPRARRGVLRAAAVAADLQADPDDRRDGSLLPDREMFPRRGPARRSPARVHPGRPRDLLRDRGPRVLDSRAADGPPDGAHRPRGAARRSGGCRTRKRSRGTDRTSPTCGPAWSSWICRRRSPRRASPCSAARSRPAATCAGSS